jgi:hypothetical membrane protein
MGKSYSTSSVPRLSAMNDKMCSLLGIIGPLAAYGFIGISIASAPWFRWSENALSDLGHALKSNVAPLFNFGLAVAGFLVLIYAVTGLWRHAKFSSLCLAASAFALQLIAVFDEVYGSLHLVVSVLFFVSIGIASIVYAIEKRSLLAAIDAIVCLASWISYWAGLYDAGIAVPEIVSATAVVSWIVWSTWKTYSEPITGSK